MEGLRQLTSYMTPTDANYGVLTPITPKNTPFLIFINLLIFFLKKFKKRRNWRKHTIIGVMLASCWSQLA